MSKRVVSYDLLRVIGILVIIIAHADPPPWIIQIRSFGPILLIVTSALTHAAIYKDRTLAILPFYKKRMSRLIFPAWIFLTFFFLIYLAFSRIVGEAYPFTWERILHTYTFYSGIGFVWIFKIYMILGVATPLALYFKRRIKTGTSYYLILLLIYIAYELAIYFTLDSTPDHLKEFHQQVFSIVPYVLLYIYGMRLESLSDRKVLIISFVSLILFGVVALILYRENNHFVLTTFYRYPPRFYYMAYSFFAIHIIYLFSRHYTRLFNSKWIILLSNRAMWIYLWHILGFYILGNVVSYMEITIESQMLTVFLKTLFLLGFSLSITAFQEKFIKRYLLLSKSKFIRGFGSYL